MAQLKIIVKGIENVGNCVIVDNTITYIDNIVKNQEYVNVTTNTIKVNNICGTDFILSGEILFTQEDSFGSTFTANINTTTIPAGTIIDVPVYYNGIYKDSDSSPVYVFNINNTEVTYELNVILPA